MEKKYYKYFLLLLVPAYLLTQLEFNKAKISDVIEPENHKLIAKSYAFNHKISQKSVKSNVFSTYNYIENSQNYVVCMFDFEVDSNDLNDLVKINDCNNLNIDSSGFYGGNIFSNSILYSYVDEKKVNYISVCLDDFRVAFVKSESFDKIVLEFPWNYGFNLSLNNDDKAIVKINKGSKNKNNKIVFVLRDSRVYVLLFQPNEQMFLSK